MPSPHVTIFCVHLTVAMVTMSAWTRSGGQGRCAWWEYHDVIMDNCGPCREICDHMGQTRTVDLCRTQCADYLVSQSCGKDEYFDEIMKSCAPCRELCSQRDEKGTAQQCFQQCPDYLHRNPPGNSLVEPFNTDLDPSSSSSSSSSSFSSWLPPIVATVCIGAIAVAAIFGTLVVYRRHTPRAGTDVNQNGRRGSGNGNDGARERFVQSIPLGVPVQVSSQAMTEDVEVGQRRSRDGVNVHQGLLQPGFGDPLAVGALDTRGYGHGYFDRDRGGVSFGDSLGDGDLDETAFGDTWSDGDAGLQARAYGHVHAFCDHDRRGVDFDDTLSDGSDLNAIDFGDSLTDSDLQEIRFGDTIGDSDLSDNVGDSDDLRGLSDTSSDNDELQNIAVGGRGEGEGEWHYTEPKTLLVGIAECDPHAPSSSAFWHVRRELSTST